MNKQEFLNTLNRHLKKLKKGERQKYLDYYEEIISDIMESGISEAEAIKKQGSIEQLAHEILANASPESLKKRDIRGICLIAASLFLLICSFLSIFITIQMKQLSTAISIIGGADGPTSIFVAGKIGTPWGLYIAAAVVVIVTVIYFVKKHRK